MALGGYGDNDSAHSASDDECSDGKGVKLSLGGRIGNLMRSWDDTKPEFISMPYHNNPQIEEGYGDIADGFILGRNKYSSRRYQTSKKVKK